MSLDFNWWLLLVGLGFGAALTWLILADLGRREADLSARERGNEVLWVADELAAEGTPAPDQLVERVLELHATYLRRSPGAMADDEDDLADDGAAPGDGVAPDQTDEAHAGEVDEGGLGEDDLASATGAVDDHGFREPTPSDEATEGATGQPFEGRAVDQGEGRPA